MEACKTLNHNEYKKPYPTLGEIVKGKNYDYVDYRIRLNKKTYPKLSPKYWFKEGVFAGAFKVVNGEIVPLDYDTYSLKEPVLESEEWLQDNVTNGLTIIVADMFVAERA